MLIDCNSCVARDLACDDCVVTVLLATPPPAIRPAYGPGDPSDRLDLDEADRVAIEHLASAGLVPPLRLVSALPSGDQGAAAGQRAPRMSGNDREIA